MIAWIELRLAELFPLVGFTVTDLPMKPNWVARLYNKRGTAEQRIKEDKYLSVGPGCPANGSLTTRCVCNGMRWPRTWSTHSVASNC